MEKYTNTQHIYVVWLLMKKHLQRLTKQTSESRLKTDFKWFKGLLIFDDMGQDWLIATDEAEITLWTGAFPTHVWQLKKSVVNLVSCLLVARKHLKPAEQWGLRNRMEWNYEITRDELRWHKSLHAHKKH